MPGGFSDDASRFRGVGRWQPSSWRLRASQLRPEEPGSASLAATPCPEPRALAPRWSCSHGVTRLQLIAFVVCLARSTCRGFFGTFIVLYALYRFTRLSAILALALSIYWGFLGYHLGAATGEFRAAPLPAVVGFLVAIWVHIEGFYRLSAHAQRVPDSQPGAPRAAAGAASMSASAEVIDVEYRVVSP